jgi:hypothetical protein
METGKSRLKAAFFVQIGPDKQLKAIIYLTNQAEKEKMLASIWPPFCWGTGSGGWLS